MLTPWAQGRQISGRTCRNLLEAAMNMIAKTAAAALAAVALCTSPVLAQKITFTLNWVAGGDHAPYFYAQKMGSYKQAGLDVDFETGRGSAASAQKVGAGQSQLGLSDMAGVLLFRGKGVDAVGVMNVYANSPQGLYWLKSSGIASAKDLAGKKIGNPAGDGARTMWPALAKKVGIDPASVVWVNIDANAKLSALKARTVDATTSFFNLHHVFARELGSDMGFLAWKDAGVNPYGNSIIANGPWLKANRDKADKFVKVTQKAFAECVKTPKPCIEALVEANGALLYQNELDNWHLVTMLMNDETSRTVALGWHDDARMADDYRLVDEYLKMEKPYDVRTGYTNEFLDKDVKMPPIHPPKLY
jgi:NitT/TauT family transport system substrate-binding protein